MAPRIRNEGRVYLRRSDLKQETSLEVQLNWAIREAKSRGIDLDASLADLKYMLANGLSVYKHIYLDDGITGSDLQRPGLLALIADSVANPRVSDLFMYKRDRFARPDDPLMAMMTERQLSDAGLYLVFNDDVVLPTRRGKVDVPAMMKMLFAYWQSGEFLNTLAERVIETHQLLARNGFRTGGSAPYGFARFLVDPNGVVVEELPRNRRVRQPGYHVRILRKDEEKIAVWLRILQMKATGIGYKRIASILNKEGIPSPDAGRYRKDQGVRHRVSGKWCPNTVADLCRNCSILGLTEYGQRSEGKHRRIAAQGHRLLDDNDVTDKNKARVTRNDPSIVIQQPAGYDSLFDKDVWKQIQEQIAQRGKSQRNIRRAKDPSKYPMACRIIDLTDGCGSIMYGRTSGERRLYECGRYLRTSGADCKHNSVDAEAMLRFTLRTLIQHVDQHGGNDQLRRFLEAKASRGRDTVAATEHDSQLLRLKNRVVELQQDLATVERRMALEKDDERYAGIANQYDRIKNELRDAESRVTETERNHVPVKTTTPEQAVTAAMTLFNRIRRAAERHDARVDIPLILEEMGIRVGVTFGEGIKGKERRVRRLLGGLIAFGDHALPVPIHGEDNADGPGQCLLTDHDAGSGAHGHVEKSCEPAEGTFVASGDVYKAASGRVLCRPEAVSFTKVSRGDRTSIELFSGSFGDWTKSLIAIAQTLATRPLILTS